LIFDGFAGEMNVSSGIGGDIGCGGTRGGGIEV